MLKIVHLITGGGALLLSFTPSLRNDELSYLQQPDALYLALFGLANLLLAPLLPVRHDGVRNQLQALVSALLVFASVLQALILLAPLAQIGNQPAVSLSLITLLAATLLHLAINLGATVHAASPRPSSANSTRTARPAPSSGSTPRRASASSRAIAAKTSSCTSGPFAAKATASWSRASVWSFP